MEYVDRFMAANQEVTNEMIWRWFDIAQKEGRIQVNQPPSQVRENRRMSDQICYGSSEMQDAIQKVKEISISRNTTDPSHTQWPSKPQDKNDLENLEKKHMNRSMEKDSTNSLNLDYRSTQPRN